MLNYRIVEIREDDKRIGFEIEYEAVKGHWKRSFASDTYPTFHDAKRDYDKLTKPSPVITRKVVFPRD